GRSSGDWTHRWHSGSERRRRLVTVSAPSRPSCPQTYEESLRTRGVEPLWTRECVQSHKEVVRHGCDCNRYRDNLGDGRKSAHWIRMEDLHEKSGSTAGFPARRLHEFL